MPDWVAILNGQSGGAMVPWVGICLLLLVLTGFVASLIPHLKGDGCAMVAAKVDTLAEAIKELAQVGARTNELIEQQQQQQNEILLKALQLTGKRPISPPVSIRKQP